MMHLIRATGAVCVLLLLQAGLTGCQGAQRQDAFAEAVDRPPTPRTLHMMARLLEENGKLTQAEYVLQQIIQQTPTYLPAYVQLADLQIGQKRHHEAIATLRLAHDLAPGDPVIANNLGVLLLRQHDAAAAGEAFSAAVAADPDEARYRANLALALGMQGLYEEAFEVYLTVVPPAAAYWNVGVISEARQDAGTAQEYFAKAHRTDDKLPFPSGEATASVPVD